MPERATERLIRESFPEGCYLIVIAATVVVAEAAVISAKNSAEEFQGYNDDY